MLCTIAITKPGLSTEHVRQMVTLSGDRAIRETTLRQYFIEREIIDRPVKSTDLVYQEFQDKDRNRPCDIRVSFEYGDGVAHMQLNIVELPAPLVAIEADLLSDGLRKIVSKNKDRITESYFAS